MGVSTMLQSTQTNPETLLITFLPAMSHTRVVHGQQGNFLPDSNGTSAFNVHHRGQLCHEPNRFESSWEPLTSILQVREECKVSSLDHSARWRRLSNPARMCLGTMTRPRSTQPFQSLHGSLSIPTQYWTAARSWPTGINISSCSWGWVYLASRSLDRLSGGLRKRLQGSRRTGSLNYPMNWKIT